MLDDSDRLGCRHSLEGTEGVQIMLSLLGKSRAVVAATPWGLSRLHSRTLTQSEIVSYQQLTWSETGVPTAHDRVWKKWFTVT